MENKIKKEVIEGNGPAHLLSIKINKSNKKNIKKVRPSNSLNTNRLVLDSLFKSPL